MEVDKALHHDLVTATRRILKLGPNELRVTDSSLICKNPNYSVCDAMLRTDTVYCVEYLLSYWESRTDHVPCFVFKNTGCAVSLCCFIRAPTKLVSSRHVGEFNVLRVNDQIVVTLKDIEDIKPSAYGVLTKCVVRKSNVASVFNIELIAFGPENERDYDNLLRELYSKKSVLGTGSAGGVKESVRASPNRVTPRMARRPVIAAAPPPPPPPPFSSCRGCACHAQRRKTNNDKDSRRDPGGDGTRRDAAAVCSKLGWLGVRLKELRTEAIVALSLGGAALVYVLLRHVGYLP
ncbi:nuclear egress membrane protein [Aotine betaherpesvirus 1]|uniref:Nuclear egress membrane protein n=1 Tax=Aotine betaherpesvirus 1 TaxID=50290 RepID=G8XUC6_9BETA|nr:nuclear egress membrane protein [Aotine betaherpesvirus 1]AEV80756.1 nuclear egress membrane protein [Aotine betaherpesvirus 1]